MNEKNGELKGKEEESGDDLLRRFVAENPDADLIFVNPDGTPQDDNAGEGGDLPVAGAFPTHCLPEEFMRSVELILRPYGLQVGPLVSLCFTAISAAIGKSWKLDGVMPVWLNFRTLLIWYSGSNKSRHFNTAFNPLNLIDARMRNERKKEMKKYQERMRVRNNMSPQEIKKDNEQNGIPERPPITSFQPKRATLQALLAMHDSNQDGISYITDEISAVLDTSKTNEGRREMMNNSWQGEEAWGVDNVTVDHDRAEHVQEPLMGMSGCITPDKFRQLDHTQDGLWFRMALVLPESYEKPDIARKKGPSYGLGETYKEILSALFAARSERNVLNLSDSAWAAVHEKLNVERRIKYNALQESWARSWHSKFDLNTLILCGLLHLLEEMYRHKDPARISEVIPEATARRALEISDYYYDMTMLAGAYFYGEMFGGRSGHPGRRGHPKKILIQAEQYWKGLPDGTKDKLGTAARRFGIGRTTLYRHLKANGQMQDL